MYSLKWWSGAVLIDKFNGIIGIDTGYVGNTCEFSLIDFGYS